MSRLSDKIAKTRLNIAIAQEQLNLAENRLNYLEMKQRRYSQKSEIKAFRKKLRNPSFRATHFLLKSICKDMLKPNTFLSKQEFNGIDKQIRFPKFSDES